MKKNTENANVRSRMKQPQPDRMGVYIKTRRKKLKLTQDKLARQSDLSYQQVQVLESLTKKRDPRLSTLDKLARGLQMTTWDMLREMFGP